MQWMWEQKQKHDQTETGLGVDKKRKDGGEAQDVCGIVG